MELGEEIKVTNTITFILRAMYVHKGFYTYDKVIYVNSKVKVIITCRIHGDFEQTPNNHLSGQGCPVCGDIKRKLALSKSSDWFITRAVEVHGSIYIYNKVIYINGFTPAVITCKIHGDFEQIPSDHLQGSGCPKCAVDKRALIRTKTTEQFIYKAEQLHGDTCCYNLVNYENTITPVPFRCKVHDHVFLQAPRDHLKCKTPCPVCAGSKLSEDIFRTLSKLGVIIKSEIGLNGLNPKCKYDYYIPEYRTLIEVHGEQHYKFSPLYHMTKDRLKEQQERDKIKKDIALKKGYNYIEIAYTVDPENLEDILKKSFERFSKPNSKPTSLIFKGIKKIH